MMRWKLWDNEKDGFPPRYAVVLNDGTSSRCMVLQQLVKVYRSESGKYFAGEYQEYQEWQDVQLSIESKK
jgi:hypothetical protein